MDDGQKFVGNTHIFAAAKATEEEDEPRVFINKVSQSYVHGWSCQNKFPVS